MPAHSSADSQLGHWVNNQRTNYSKGKLSKDRVRRLEAIGFSWDPKDSFWEEMFLALVEFKKARNHYNVPQGWRENPQLALWVQNQRARKGILSEDRIRRLDEIGFQWKIR